MYRLYQRRRPAVWHEMDRLQREMNRLFEGNYPGRGRRPTGYPAMNVWSSEDGLIVTAELPGVKQDDIEISVLNETLTLSGERSPDEMEEEARYHRQERGSGKFRRAIQLPYRVEADHVGATFHNGVLNITLPRAEEDKPKKIAVKAL